MDTPQLETQPPSPIPFTPWLDDFYRNGRELQADDSILNDENPLLLETTTINTRTLESIQAEELTKMGMKEREQVYEEIHGVDQVIAEDPDFVAEHLELFDRELGKIRMKPAYDQAELINKAYVNDRKFRLSFLRADRFDPKKAAFRLVSYMEGKLEFFGPQVLCRPIYISDLDDDDLESLRSGSFQLLPSRDRAGRAIFMHHICETRFYKRPENMLKALIYILLATAEDEETQRRGMVSVSYTFGPVAKSIDHAIASRCPHILEWAPLKLSSLHLGLDDPMMEHLIPLIKLSMGYERRRKFRVLFGTCTEFHYQLMTFGIPVESIPVTYEAELKTKEHSKWMARREKKESAMLFGADTSFDGINLPGQDDVLLGKGKPIQNHPGNIRIRMWVDMHLEEYKNSFTGQKQIYAGKAVAAMKQHPQRPCRFLKRNKQGWWVQVPDEEAVQKVLKIFRSALAAGSTTRFAASQCTEFENSKRARIAGNRAPSSCLNILFCGGDNNN